MIKTECFNDTGDSLGIRFINDGGSWTIPKGAISLYVKREK